MIVVSVCLPSNALSQHLTSYLGSSYLGCGVSLHGCSSKAQPLLLTLDVGYLLSAPPASLSCHSCTTQPQPQSQRTSHLITWTTALSNSVKLSHAVQGHRRQTGHGGEVWQNVVHWRREWKPLQYSCLENPMNRQKDRTLKDELPRSVGAQYATGDQQRNNSRKNEGMEPKQKQHPVVDGTGDRRKVRCCKEQYLLRNLEC